MLEHPYLTDARAHHGRTIHDLASAWGVESGVAHARLIQLRRIQPDVPRVSTDGVICDPRQVESPAEAGRATPAEWTQIEDEPSAGATFQGVMAHTVFQRTPVVDSPAVRMVRHAQIRARAMRAAAQLANPLDFGAAMMDRGECARVARDGWKMEVERG